MNASYELIWDMSTPTRLVIRDVGPHDQHKTVTNDAEWVVARLLDCGWLKPHMRLFYYDSEGTLDELRHDGRRFTGFGCGQFPMGLNVDLPYRITQQV